MDGLFHSNYHQEALARLRRLPEDRRTSVGELASRVFQPPMFKRIPVDDPRYGAPFFGTSALMRADPDASYLLARRTPRLNDLFVDETTLLIPRSGQLVGIIGHAVLPHGDVVNGTITEDAIRVFCPGETTAGYLLACLSSEYGRRQLKSRAFGSSIPHLNEGTIAGAVLPRLDAPQMDELGRRAFAARTARHRAVYREREARALVEHWIERQGAA
jgi:type I restriction enzyme S subunit